MLGGSVTHPVISAFLPVLVARLKASHHQGPSLEVSEAVGGGIRRHAAHGAAQGQHDDHGAAVGRALAWGSGLRAGFGVGFG